MTLWSGRFEEGPADLLWRYTVSITDRRLLVDDVEGSLAHAEMLFEVGLVTAEEHQGLQSGLRRILADAGDDLFEFLDSDEDVHTAVERRLIELVGDAGKKLHTGRSRNDQVALDLRLYLRRAAANRIGQLRGFGRMLLSQAGRHTATVVPAYTHLQQAQAVPLAHHLLAYGWMALRDIGRFTDLSARLGVSPLGAGAAGGSSLPIDPVRTARRLGFEVVFANSMDAVSARDLVAEYAWCCAQTMVHLSRLAEELVLWNTTEFGWVTFTDALTTGSSALPHKKNPDIAELARGRSAGAIGHLTALLVLQKGLPLTYNRDLQEDKEHVFRGDDLLASTLEALTALVETAVFDPPPPSPWVTALDLAETLVGRGVPFREAHQAVGRLVAALVRDGRDLGQTRPDDLAAADERFEPGDVIDPAASVGRRVSLGGGSLDSVRRQLEALAASFS